MAIRRRAPSGADLERVLVVGLGNPGKQYARTRHNVGTDAVELLANRTSSALRAGRDRARVAEVRFGSVPAVLAVPTTYMNDSGEAVGPLARRFKIDEASRIVIVHDELDLDPGTVRVKVGGGLAGHNGLRSISRVLRTDDYVRVRIGVGKPRSREQGADHVLSAIPSAERKVLDVAVAAAADAVERIVTAGVDAAMQEFNGR
ncbi:MAG: peptidyl-tRNA hydrolase [Actinomycetota bacterium]|jgi:PTH1 family peptidyl-tRNA hydrolase